MEKPDISWFIKEGESYSQEDDCYLGSYSESDEIKIELQVWNNRYGTQDVEEIDNAELSICFESIEDSFILNYCNISIDNGVPNKPVIDVDRGIVTLGEMLGLANDGRDSQENKYNYYNIEIIFKNLPSNLKKGLKSIFINIEHN